MGTNSTTKFLKYNAGRFTEVYATLTSAGAGDANKLVALNASGVLDDSIINASATASANKVVKMNASGLIDDAILGASTTSAANKIVKLNGSGILDIAMLPGAALPYMWVTSSEALSAGNFVNLYDSAGIKVRKANAGSALAAHGFVLDSVASGASVKVYFHGPNTACSGLTVGPQWLSTVAGGSSSTYPTSAGQIVQVIGIALNSTTVLFQPQIDVAL